MVRKATLETLRSMSPNQLENRLNNLESEFFTTEDMLEGRQNFSNNVKLERKLNLIETEIGKTKLVMNEKGINV
jgi:ribosomal protein L29